MKPKNKISIIMPAYNCEKYIEESINSVLNQIYNNWELLIINDGSTDRTGRIIDEYAQNDIRIRVIHTANNGVSHARNMGLDMATGEWVAFLDSDDILPANALFDLISASEGNDLVIGNYCEFPKEKEKILLSTVKNIDKKELMKSIQLTGAAWGMIFRTNTIKECFPEELQLGEDTIFLFAQLRHCSHISTINSIVYKYRRGNEQSLSNQTKNMKVIFIEMYCCLITELNNKTDEYLYAFFIHSLGAYIRQVSNNTELNITQKEERINEIISNELFKKIPLVQLRLKPKEMRLFAIMKTGDIALIKAELNIG